MRNPNPFVASPTDPTLDAFGRRYPIELKNIDFNPHFTRETHCFRATVYLDGKRVMKVENDGNGGPDRFQFNTQIAEGKFYTAVFKSYGHEDVEPASWYMQELEEEAAQ